MIAFILLAREKTKIKSIGRTNCPNTAALTALASTLTPEATANNTEIIEYPKKDIPVETRLFK